MPWIAAASIFLNVFLLGSVDRDSYIRFGFWTVISVVFYVLYSVHSTYDAEEQKLGDSLKDGFEPGVPVREKGPLVVVVVMDKVDEVDVLDRKLGQMKSVVVDVVDKENQET